MILVVALNPALDVTYHVAGADWSGVNRPVHVATRAGGKGLNVARALRALGQQVMLTGLAGGPTGQALVDGLGGTGVEVALTAIAADTRRTFAVADTVRGETALFNEPGPAIESGEYHRFLISYESKLRSTLAVVLSGSLPVGVPADAYAGLIATAASAGVPVVLDTSGAALRHGAAAGPTLVKPNLAELEEATGQSLGRADAPDLAAVKAAARWLASPQAASGSLAGPAPTSHVAGPVPTSHVAGGSLEGSVVTSHAASGSLEGPAPISQAVSGSAKPSAGLAGSDGLAGLAGLVGAGTVAVVVSLGRHGLLATGTGGTWAARPPGAVAGNPTGAGDAVVAGLVDGLVRGRDWPDLLRHGAAVGTAAAAAPVAGEFSLAEYERLVPAITVIRMEALDEAGWGHVACR